MIETAYGMGYKLMGTSDGRGEDQSKGYPQELSRTLTAALHLTWSSTSHSLLLSLSSNQRSAMSKIPTERPASYNVSYQHLPYS